MGDQHCMHFKLTLDKLLSARHGILLAKNELQVRLSRTADNQANLVTTRKYGVDTSLVTHSC